MSNALIYSINEIKNQIPYEILYAGMTYGEDPQLLNMSTLEDKILNKVFRKRVLITTNMVGGIETIIPINQATPVAHETMYTVYQISPDLTMNKEIISALGLCYMPMTGHLGMAAGYSGMGYVAGPNNQSGFGMNPVMNVASRIGSAASSQGVLSNAHLEIVSRNTIAVYANYRTLTNFGMRVVLENDTNMNNIQPRSYPALATLGVLATKAFIYNKLIVAMNSGYLSGGQDLGVFKSIVESYGDAEEQYNTYLREVWAKVAYINDTTRYSTYLSSMIAPDL